jgi:IclR family acetate operon transcriptional repressor
LFNLVKQKRRSVLLHGTLDTLDGVSAFPALENALNVLGVFAEKDEMGISEVARRLAIPKSGVHRVVRTLVARGFVEQRPNRRYCLGVRLLELGNLYRLRLDLIRLAEPVLRRLSTTANANAHLARLENAEVLDLLRVEHPAPLRVARSPMLRRPPHCTALGKALLAFGSAAQIDRTIAAGLPRLTARTITRPDRLLAELSSIRERGFAVDNEEFYAGMRCIAAPVFDENGEAAAAMSISGLITQVTEDRVEVYAALVVECSLELSVHLGYRRAIPADA